MELPSHQIAFGLVLISIGIVITLDIKIDLLKKRVEKIGVQKNNNINLIK